MKSYLNIYIYNYLLHKEKKKKINLINCISCINYNIILY
jgi:hypothetical protein